MKLTRLCKAAESGFLDKCPAMYVSEDTLTMVSQGKVLDSETKAELLNLSDDEDGVSIPTETVLRAAGLFLAYHGVAEVAVLVDQFLADAPWAKK